MIYRFRWLNKLIRALNLAIYSPMKYILPSKIAEYSKKYDTKTGKSVFRQIDRETSLIHLMRINILKRMEVLFTLLELQYQKF